MKTVLSDLPSEGFHLVIIVAMLSDKRSIRSGRAYSE